MTQNDFNSAFQDLTTQPFAPPPDPRQVALQIVQRDRSRTRILAGLCLFFWLAGTAGMLLLVYGLNRLVIYIRIADLLPHGSEPATRPMTVSPTEMEMLWGTSLIHHSMPWIACSVVAIMLAALFTVLLILHSRQATLNRININLRQIAELLQQTRDNTPKEKS
jgi:hypothetical protein